MTDILHKSLLTYSFLAGILTLYASTAEAGIRRYVAPTGSGQEDATSWENASPHLQMVIDGCNPGDTVWVARGTYTGGFLMREGVTVMGGFLGTEQKLEDRTTGEDAASLTTLSGDGFFRVLTQPVAFATTTVWDGFVLKDGVAGKGAGAYLRENGILRNCRVEGNVAGRLSVGEYSRTEGGIVFHPYGSKTIILATEETGRNHQQERAAELAKTHSGGGHTDWRLPTAVELKTLMPTQGTYYSAYCLTELGLKEQKKTALEGQRYWTSTSASSNAMKGAGCCDFGCMQYFALNTYQYNKVRAVRECQHPQVQGHGAGVYAEGGCLDCCTVSGNTGATEIEDNGKLVILEPTPDRIAANAGGSLIQRVWKAGESIHLPSANRAELFDSEGRMVAKGTSHLQLPTRAGVYLLHWQSKDNVSAAAKITVTK